MLAASMRVRHGPAHPGNRPSGCRTTHGSRHMRRMLGDRLTGLRENAFTVEVMLGANHMAPAIVQANGKLSAVVFHGSHLGPLCRPFAMPQTREVHDAL